MGVEHVYEKPLQLETLSEIINSVYLDLSDSQMAWVFLIE